MGKWCLHASLFIFDRIIIKVDGNQNRHKSSVKFNFGPNQTTHFGVTCSWVTKISHFELEYLWSQLVNLDQILFVASLGWGKGCIRFWGRLTWHIGLRWAIVALWATCFSKVNKFGITNTFPITLFPLLKRDSFWSSVKLDTNKIMPIERNIKSFCATA